MKQRDLFRRFLLMGGITAFLAVAFGAFGAHSLRDVLTKNDTVSVYQTAAQYQMAHALALILVALLAERLNETRLIRAVGNLFGAGMVLFSGSLYLLAITNIKWLGAITPLGGLCFLTGWVLLTAAAWRESR